MNRIKHPLCLPIILLFAAAASAGGEDAPLLAGNDQWQVRLQAAAFAEITGTQAPPFIVPGSEGDVITKVALRGAGPARKLLALALELKTPKGAPLNITDEPLRAALGKDGKELRFVTLTIPAEWKPEELQLSGATGWRGFIGGERKAGDVLLLVAVYELTQDQQEQAAAGKLEVSIIGLKDIPPVKFTVIKPAES